MPKYQGAGEETNSQGFICKEAGLTEPQGQLEATLSTLQADAMGPR